MCECSSNRLCGTCTRILMDDLRVLSGKIGTFPFRTLLEELDVTITKTDAVKTMNVGPVSTGDDTQPLAYDERASDAREHVEACLRAVWHRLRREYPHLSIGLSPAEIAHSLVSLTGLIKEHSEVHRLAHIVRRAVVEGQAAIDRPSDRFYLGPCRGRIDGVICDKSLYSDDRTPSIITCRLCGTVHNVEERRRIALGALENCLCTTSQLEGLVWPGGAILTKSAIRGMKHEGKIRSYGKNARGADLFRVGDVTSVMRARLSL